MPTRPDVEYCAELAKHIKSLRGFAQSLTRNSDKAEELTHETICRALECHVQFERGTNLCAWLFAIAKNQWRNEMRKSHRLTFHDEYHPNDLPIPFNEGKVSEWVEGLTLLSKIPEHTRPMMLDVAYGMSYEEVAQKYGVPIGTAKSRICRGREQLQLLIDGKVKEDGRKKRGGHSRWTDRRNHPNWDARLHTPQFRRKS